MNALKALQPPTTIPATILRLEENSGQSFSSVEVEKEEKDIRFLEDISTCIGSPKSINNQDNRIMIRAGDQSCVPEKNVPSHVLRKQQLGGLIFDAKVEIPVGFDLRTFEGLYCDIGRERE
uniref:Uncharacterized protein n=1 Tax=Tanacetum cinerariifolium TaxID=118510 RepID=A0A6L2JE15_TANCI|nr:hypothetical protein [Tanacetum cinerariifolium]